MRALAAFELQLLLGRASAAIIPAGGLLLALGIGLLAGPGYWQVPYGLEPVHGIYLGARDSALWYLQPPSETFAGRPDDLNQQIGFQVTRFAATYSLLYTYYGLALSLIGFVVGLTGTAEPGSPISALPIPAARRTAGRVAGRLGAVVLYHLLVWPAIGLLAINGPFPPWGLLTAFLWPPALAAIFTLCGSMVRHLAETKEGHGAILAGTAPLLVLAALAVKASVPIDVFPLGIDPLVLGASPGLPYLLGSAENSPFYLRSDTLLALMLVLNIGALAVLFLRREDVL